MFGAEDQQDDTRIEAVLAEYLRRIDQGENVDHEQFIAEHPAFSEPLRDYFETAAKIARMAGLPEATLDSDAQSGKSESALAVVRYFGDYELFDVIARGGMGVVYRARQVSLNRVVALKMILAGKLADEADVSRFHAEAEAAAILDHPGIVPIYEIGDHKGQHYFSMGYVDGESLSGRIKDGPLPPREAAAYMLKIAEAVAFAHEHGVIHRDLKPSNVLLDRAGELKVSDFGLAKRVQSDSDLTATGQVLGTPSYMPPEQASGEVDDITALSDIYSLGATCYCLLTGNPPFAAASAVETLRQVVETEPIPPKDVNPDVDLDLQTITLKCLEKRPERRYASARELAAELERFLNGEPIHARPISAMDRLWRWCKRRPKVAGLTAAVVLMALFIAIVSPLVALRQESLRRDADKRAQEAQAARGQARTSQSKAEKRERVANRYLYDAHMNLAMLAWEEGNVPRVRQLLDLHLPQSDEDDTRTFVWYYLHNLCETKHVRVLNHGAPVSCVAFSPDSATLASSSADGIVRLWNPTSGQSKLTIRTRALGSSAVDFSPDGTTLAISFPPRATALLDVASGKIKTTIDRRGGHPAAIAFSPDGAVVATGSDNNTVRLWESSTGREIAVLGGHTKEVRCIDFSPDGKTLATGAGELFGDSEVRLWDPTVGRLKTELRGHRGEVYRVVFSPDGKTLMTSASDATVRVWDVESGLLKTSLSGHVHEVHGLAVSSDGQILASGGADMVVRLWSLSSGEQVAALGGHEDDVRSVAIAPDNKLLASAGLDGKVRLHNLDELDASTVLATGGEVVAAVFSPSGSTLATTCSDHEVYLWETSTGKKLAQFPGTGLAPAFSADGRTLIAGTGRQAGVVNLWDLSSGQATPILKPLDPVDYATTSIACSPDGQYLAIGLGNWKTSTPGMVKICDFPSGTVRAELEAHDRQVESLAFSPDSTILVTAGWDQYVKFWDAATGGHLSSVKGHDERVMSVSFSPDGKKLVSTSWDRTAKLWDVATRKVILALNGHRSPVSSAAFSPDGKTLATASWDGKVKFWDVETGEERATLNAHAQSLWTTAFSPDGETLITSSKDGTVKLWYAPRQNPGREPIKQHYLDLAYAYASGQAWEDAVTFYDKAVAAGADVSNVHGDRGYANYMSTDWEAAITDLSRATEITPHDPTTWHRLGLSYAGQEDWGNALGALNRAVDLKPDDVRLRADRAKVQAMAGHWDDATADLAKLVDLAPHAMRNWQGLAAICLQTGNMELYRNTCHSALEQFADPQWWEAARLVHLCSWASAVGIDREQLDQLIDRVIVETNRDGPIIAKGMNAYRRGLYAQALENLPEAGDVLCMPLSDFFRAMAHHQLGNHPAARKALLQGTYHVYEHFPTTQGPPMRADFADRWLCYYMLHAVQQEAGLLILNRNYTCLERAIDLIVTGNYAEANQEVTKLLEIMPNSPELLMMRGDTLVLQNDWSAAAEEYARALECGTADEMTFLRALPLLIMGGRDEGFREYCRAAIERFNEDAQYWETAIAIKVALLLPGTVEVTELPLHVLKEAVANGSTHPKFRGWFEATLALADYRRGRYEDVLRWVGRSEETRTYAEEPALRALALILRALALHGQGRVHDARESLAQADTLIQDNELKLPSGGLRRLWYDWVIASILAREATSLVKDLEGIRQERLQVQAESGT